MIATSSYEIRMLDIQSFNNVYIPLILDLIQRNKNEFIPWSEDLEDAFEWMVGEALQDAFGCRVVKHYKSDMGQYLIDLLTSFKFDFSVIVEQIRASTRPIKPKHIKAIILGNILIVALLHE